MYKESESQEQTAIQLRLPLPVEAYGNPWNPDAENPAYSTDSKIGNGVRYMNTQTKPVSEINRRATHILFKEMGVVDTIRFLNQFSVGRIF